MKDLFHSLHEDLPVNFIQIPIFTIAISSFFPKVNLLSSPLSISKFFASFIWTLLIFVIIRYFVKATYWLDWKFFKNNKHVKASGFIGYGLLTWCLALTIKYIPPLERFKNLELFQNSNFYRLVALYLLSIMAIKLNNYSCKKTRESVE